MAGSAVWVDVLPSMSEFGPELTREATKAASSAGAAAGKSFDAGMASEASRGGGVKRVLGEVASTAGKVLGVVSAGVVGVGATIATVAAKKGIDRLLDIDSAQAKLKGLGHDVNGIAVIMDSALASVKGTAFGLGDAATVAASAVAAGIKPGQDLTKYLSLTADAATIAGVSLSEMGSIINKTTSTGKVYTDNLNQLADRGIPIFTWLQKEYGVSAEGLSDMVQKGQVDSETFRRVIEENIGGAALASGQSVRGAWANVGAALGRLGAMFLKGGVAAAPTLFTSITGAVDRGAAALAPYADILSVKVVAGLTAVAGWIDRIDFQKVVDGAAGLYDLIVNGDFTGKLVEAFGWQEDAPVVDVILSVRDALGMMFDAAKAGDAKGVADAFSSLTGSGTALGDVVGPVAGGIVDIAKGVGDLIAAGLPILPALLQSGADILGFFADNTEILTPLIVALATGFLLYKTSQTAANAAAVAGLPIRILSTAADIARTIALNNSTKATLLQMGVEKSSIATRVLATGSITAATVATTGYSGASRIAGIASAIFSGGLRLVGAAVRFALGPVGLIITAIGLLVAGVIWAYNNVGWFHDGVNAAFAGIKVAIGWLGDAAVWLWENAIKPTWDAIATGATWLWQTILKPAFDGIGAVFQAVGGYVMTYIGFWVTVFTAVGTAASWLWTNALKPAFEGIWAVISWVGTAIFAVFDLLVHILIFVVGAAFTWLWENVISPVFTWIGDKVSLWWTAAQIIFSAVVSYVRDTLGAVFSWLYDNIISPVFDWISSKVTLWWTATKIIFGLVTSYLRDTLGPIFTWLYENIIKPAFDGISSTIKWVWDNAIKPVFDALKGFVEDTLPKAFETGRDAIGKAWEGLKDLAKAPIKFVVDTVINDGLIGNFNKLADFFGSKKIPEISLPKGFAGGGVIPGYQSQKRDDVMMPMRRGEGVLVPEVVKALGSGFVHRLNAAGNTGGATAVRQLALPDGLAEGGIVGGVIDWIGDAAGAASSFIGDPLGSLKKVIDPILAQVPGAEGLASMAKGAGSKLIDAAVEAIKKLGPGPATATGENGRLPAGLLSKVANFVGGPGVGPMGGYLRTDAARALAMAEGAKGGSLPLTEGYRDLASQQMRWAAYQSGRGNLAAAPGTSNHGYGLAGDFATGAQAWLAKNGPAFGWYPTGLGFSQREPWHFDYKGKGGNGSTGMFEGGLIEPTLYDGGGMLNQGVSLIANNTQKPEYALPEGKLIDIVRSASSGSEGEVHYDPHFHYEGREFTERDYMNAQEKMDALRGE